MASTRIVSAFAIIVFAALGTACSSSNSDTPSGGGSGGSGGVVAGGGTSGTGASGGTGGSAGSSGSGPTCDPGPGFPSSDGQHDIHSVNGTIVDTDGQPAMGVPVLVCGLDVCAAPATTDDQGHIVSNCDQLTGVCALGLNLDPALPEKLPALKYGYGLDYAKFVLPLDTSTGATDFDMGTNTTVRLPAIASGADFVPGGDSTSGNITLTMPADGVAKVDKLEYDTPELQRFRAAEIPVAKAPAAVDASQNFEILVATTPVEAELCPAAKLTVPNTPGWAAGTAVEFWVHGVDIAEEWAPYGGWAKTSDGTVSSDGTTVSTDDGQGIRTLSVFGVKKK
jgi:hypothetical protein